MKPEQDGGHRWPPRRSSLNADLIHITSFVFITLVNEYLQFWRFLDKGVNGASPCSKSLVLRLLAASHWCFASLQQVISASPPCSKSSVLHLLVASHWCLASLQQVIGASLPCSNLLALCLLAASHRCFPSLRPDVGASIHSKSSMLRIYAAIHLCFCSLQPVIGASPPSRSSELRLLSFIISSLHSSSTDWRQTKSTRTNLKYKSFVF